MQSLYVDSNILSYTNGQNPAPSLLFSFALDNIAGDC